MKSADTDHDDPTFIRARGFVVVQTLDKCKARLVTQMSNASAIWKETLSTSTKQYREIIRDADPKSSDKVKAKSFDEIVRILAEHDKIVTDKTADMKARKEKIALVDEADAEVKAYKSVDSDQTALAFPDDESKVPGMPWATDKALGVIFTALRDLDESGAQLDDYQQALMLELAEAEIAGADLGLEAAQAMVDENNVEEFTDAEAGIDTEDENEDDVF